MKTFSDIVNHMNLNNHNITIAQVRKTVTSWGKRNTLVRSVVKYQVWLDSNDNNDRVVISGEVILNNKKTGPEKGVDMPTVFFKIVVTLCLNIKLHLLRLLLVPYLG
ncbi:hypothetical protein [Morganella morganii]|uniref:hypothetical protein n=1 Tax=Morganella morganii TaxID=582 RepID=UPI00388F0E81